MVAGGSNLEIQRKAVADRSGDSFNVFQKLVILLVQMGELRTRIGSVRALNSNFAKPLERIAHISVFIDQLAHCRLSMRRVSQGLIQTPRFSREPRGRTKPGGVIPRRADPRTGPKSRHSGVGFLCHEGGGFDGGIRADIRDQRQGQDRLHSYSVTRLFRAMWKGVVMPIMTIQHTVNDAFRGLISPESKKIGLNHSYPSICR